MPPNLILASIWQVGRRMAHVITTVAEGLGAWLLIATVIGLIGGAFMIREATFRRLGQWRPIRPLQQTSAVGFHTPRLRAGRFPYFPDTLQTGRRALDAVVVPRSIQSSRQQKRIRSHRARVGSRFR